MNELINNPDVGEEDDPNSFLFGRDIVLDDSERPEDETPVKEVRKLTERSVFAGNSPPSGGEDYSIREEELIVDESNILVYRIYPSGKTRQDDTGRPGVFVHARDAYVVENPELMRKIRENYGLYIGILPEEAPLRTKGIMTKELVLGGV